MSYISYLHNYQKEIHNWYLNKIHEAEQNNDPLAARQLIQEYALIKKQYQEEFWEGKDKSKEPDNH